MLQAIETTYNGVRFRSRLEARWAHFFDQVGMGWRFEPEGWVLPSGRRYVPDFEIAGCAVEVKPTEEAFEQSKARLVEFVGSHDELSDFELWVLIGPPEEAGQGRHVAIQKWSPHTPRTVLETLGRLPGHEWYPDYFVTVDHGRAFLGCAPCSRIWFTHLENGCTEHGRDTSILGDAFDAASKIRFWR